MRNSRMQSVGTGSVREAEKNQQERLEQERKKREYGDLRDELYRLYVRVRKYRDNTYSPGNRARKKDRRTLLGLAEMLSSRDIDPVDYISYVANSSEDLYISRIASEGLVDEFQQTDGGGGINHFARLKGLEESAGAMEAEFVLHRGIRQGIEPPALYLFALHHDLHLNPELIRDAVLGWVLTSQKQRNLMRRTHPEEAEVIDGMARERP